MVRVDRVCSFHDQNGQPILHSPSELVFVLAISGKLLSPSRLFVSFSIIHAHQLAAWRSG